VKNARKHIFANGAPATGAVDQFLVQELSQSNINGKSTSSSNRTRHSRRVSTANGGALGALRAERARDRAGNRQAAGSCQPIRREVLVGSCSRPVRAVRYERTSILAALCPNGKKARAKVIGIYDGITAASGVRLGRSRRPESVAAIRIGAGGSRQRVGSEEHGGQQPIMCTRLK